jgi:transcriptional regulator with XRE-family HTH domain
MTIFNKQMTMDNINFLLKERKLTKEKLAAKMGIKRENLQRMLSPNGNPTLYNIQKIADSLNVEVWRLFSGSGENVIGAVMFKNEVFKIQSKVDLKNLLTLIDNPNEPIQKSSAETC